ncbi:hypothetical protein [Nitratireductor aquibiodomus]|uniref:hypothetical protein n=1 Tax=Nitratireductor aquibiodomus TaxID=204799 RepID=UPI000A64CD31|nr:hypothetical protein [Nitratireductor aquibiodomus]
MDANISTIIFDNVGNKEQIEMLLEFAEFMPNDADAARITEHIRTAKTISVQRNKIVHASWGLLDSEPARFWSGLTSAHFDRIMDGGQKGNSMLEKFVFPVSRLKKLTKETILLRGLLQEDLALTFPDGPRSRHEKDMRKRMEERRAEALKQIEEMRASSHGKPE